MFLFSSKTFQCIILPKIVNKTFYSIYIHKAIWISWDLNPIKMLYAVFNLIFEGWYPQAEWSWLKKFKNNSYLIKCKINFTPTIPKDSSSKFQDSDEHKITGEGPNQSLEQRKFLLEYFTVEIILWFSKEFWSEDVPRERQWNTTSVG